MKKLISFITALACSLMLSVTISADNECYIVNTGETDAVLYDMDDSLSPDEEEFAKNLIVLTSIGAETNVGVVITSEIPNGDSLFDAEEYADNLFDEYFGSDNHGALLLINNKNYYNWISLNGEIFGYGDPSYVDEYLGDMSVDLINGKHLNAIEIFCQNVTDTVTEFRQQSYAEQTTTENTVSETEPATEKSLAEKYDLSRCKPDEGFYSIVVDNNIALLHDADNSLTKEDEDYLIRRIIDTTTTTDFSVAIVVTDDIGPDKSDYGVMDFADVYYEDHCGMNTDGILLLLNNDTKYDWISTSGSCIDTFNYSIDYIFDDIWDDVKNGNFRNAIDGFCNSVVYYNENVAGYNDYDDGYHYEGEFSIDLEMAFSVILVMGIFIVIGLVIFGSIIKANYTLKNNTGVTDYLLKNSLSFSQQTDTYLRTYTTRTRVNSSSSGGHRSGGSRSHRSSGGGSHGGGGRRR